MQGLSNVLGGPPFALSAVGVAQTGSTSREQATQGIIASAVIDASIAQQIQINITLLIVS